MRSPLDLLSDIPSAQALVRATVLAAGMAGAALGGCGESIDPPAPTCGVCCHTPDAPECAPDAGQDAGSVDAGAVSIDSGPVDPVDSGPMDSGSADSGPDQVDANITIAPTCGVCCHGGPGCDAGI